MVAVALVQPPCPTDAQSPRTAFDSNGADAFVISGGRVEIQLDQQSLRDAGLTAPAPADDGRVFDIAEGDASLVLRAVDGDWRGAEGGGVTLTGGALEFLVPAGRRMVGRDFRLESDRSGARAGEFVLAARGEGGTVWFELSAERPELGPDVREFTMQADLRLASELAHRLRVGHAAGARIGCIVLHARLDRIGPAALEVDPLFVAVETDMTGSASDDSEPAGQLPGPDVVTASVGAPIQSGREGVLGSGTVGMALSTASCNMGLVAVNWNRLPSTDHPLIVQNLYRMRTEDGSGRFEQIGQAWLKHSFSTIESAFCGTTCFSLPGDQQLGVGCYDPYGASTNALVCGLGPRSGVNPFTGAFPGGSNIGSGICSTNYPARNHLGHTHTAISHKLQVRDADLMPPLSDGARYFSEAQYIVPHEYRERAASGSANLFNNVSYTEAENQGPGGVTGDVFSFALLSGTHLEEPAINAWAGATQTVVEPAAGEDGRAILACAVTEIGANMWHYEYGVYNMNLDRAIGAFRIPIPPAVTVSNVGFHAPRNHDAEPNAETWSNDPWDATVENGWIEWTTDVFATNPLANAVRFGTLYSFRFDANAPPIDVQAEIDTFKIASAVPIAVRGPAPVLPPHIVHGESGAVFAAHAFGGFVDARSESSDGVSVDRGIDGVTLHFDQPVRAIGGGVPSPAAFEVRETGGGDPPIVNDVTPAGPSSVHLAFSGPITLAEWTTIEARVEGLGGVPIVSAGDQGPGAAETDRIDIGFLPGDVDGNGRVQPVDFIRYRQYAAGTVAPSMGMPSDYLDMNRDGVFQPVDLIAFRQTLAGTGTATRVWLGATIAHPQP
ncbi:MAG: hypothetical protein HOP29_07145 [Phycisphaerales bacterium]|nr:hypothetical protein [Phycisphaerales bacterium]